MTNEYHPHIGPLQKIQGHLGLSGLSGIGGHPGLAGVLPLTEQRVREIVREEIAEERKHKLATDQSTVDALVDHEARIAALENKAGTTPSGESIHTAGRAQDRAFSAPVVPAPSASSQEPMPTPSVEGTAAIKRVLDFAAESVDGNDRTDDDVETARAEVATWDEDRIRRLESRSFGANERLDALEAVAPAKLTIDGIREHLNRCAFAAESSGEHDDAFKLWRAAAALDTGDVPATLTEAEIQAAFAEAAGLDDASEIGDVRFDLGFRAVRSLCLRSLPASSAGTQPIRVDLATEQLLDAVRASKFTGQLWWGSTLAWKRGTPPDDAMQPAARTGAPRGLPSALGGVTPTQNAQNVDAVLPGRAAPLDVDSLAKARELALRCSCNQAAVARGEEGYCALHNALDLAVTHGDSAIDKVLEQFAAEGLEPHWRELYERACDELTAIRSLKLSPAPEREAACVDTFEMLGALCDKKPLTLGDIEAALKSQGVPFSRDPVPAPAADVRKVSAAEETERLLSQLVQAGKAIRSIARWSEQKDKLDAYDRVAGAAWLHLEAAKSARSALSSATKDGAE